MATRYRFGNNAYAHFVTLSVINWIAVFSREVWEAWAYKYSSAIDYYKEEPGLLPIERMW